MAYPYTFATATTAQGSWLDANFNLIPFWGPVSTLASASTTDLGTAASACVNITGTNNITSFGSSASSTNAPIYFVTFAGILTLTYNGTSMILPNGGANITTAAGDALQAEYLGSGKWKVLAYFPLNGQPLVTGSAMLDANFGSTQGSVLYRGAATWAALVPGAAGQFLATQGPAANPQWATPAGGGNVTGAASSTNGYVVAWNGGSGTALSIGYAINTSATTIAALDTVGTFTKAQRSAPVLLTDGSTITPDFSLSNNFYVQLAGNRTLANPTNLVAGQSGGIDVYQDATGSRTLAFAWGWQFGSGSAPTLSTLGGSKDGLYYDVKVATSATVTITIATPGVVSWTAHGLLLGQKVQLTTTGALPTGYTASTTYFVSNVSTNSFSLSTTLANAAAGTWITTSGSQSGVQTCTAVAITVGSKLAIS